MLDLAAVLGDPRDDTLVYVCGPEGLLAAVEARCASRLAGRRAAPRAVRGQGGRGPGGRRARRSSSSSRRRGSPSRCLPDRSIFDVVQDAGISVLGSCHEGICGTCEQIVLEGEVDHRDSVLSESERAANDAMMVCVSRCFSDRLVLDL